MKKALTIIFIVFMQSSFFAQNLQETDFTKVSYKIEAFAPGKTYSYDIGEKDPFYHKSDSILVFTKVKIESSESKKKGLRLKFTFIDKVGNEIVCDATDVKKLIPKIECKGEMLYAEILSEEFNRFGVQFRGWRNEYSIKKNPNLPVEYVEALDRTYRVQLVNNCLEPTKWEFVLDSEDYTDFKQRKKSDNYLNQRRILAHSWFNVPMDFYMKLLKYYNPQVDEKLFNLSYDELSKKSRRS